MYVVFVFFIYFFQLIACFMVVLCIWIVIEGAEFLRFLNQVKNVDINGAKSVTNPYFIEDMAYIFLGLALFLFFWCIFGYFAAIKECMKVFKLFVTVFLIVMALQFLGVVILLLGLSSENKLPEVMKTVTDDYRYLRDHKLNKTVPQVIHPLDHLMEYYQCCGGENYTDFKEKSEEVQSHDPGFYDQSWLPEACCKTGHNCTVAHETVDTNVDRPCLDALDDLMENHKTILISIGIGLSTLQIIMMGIAFCLWCYTKDDRCLCIIKTEKTKGPTFMDCFTTSAHRRGCTNRSCAGSDVFFLPKVSSSCDYGSSHRKHSEYSKPQISSNNSLKYSLSRTLGGSSYSHIQPSIHRVQPIPKSSAVECPQQSRLSVSCPRQHMASGQQKPPTPSTLQHQQLTASFPSSLSNPCCTNSMNSEHNFYKNEHPSVQQTRVVIESPQAVSVKESRNSCKQPVQYHPDSCQKTATCQPLLHQAARGQPRAPCPQPCPPSVASFAQPDPVACKPFIQDTICKPGIVTNPYVSTDKCPPLDVAIPALRDRCRLQRELHGREIQLLYQREHMLLEQQLHHREQLLWDQEQFRRQQLIKREQQFRFKAQQQNMEQDLHNRDEVIRGDHGEMIWERDIYQQNQIVAKARQQMLLQRDMLNNQENEVSQRRVQIYDTCFNNTMTCGPDVELSVPQLKPKVNQRGVDTGNDLDTSSRLPEIKRSPSDDLPMEDEDDTEEEDEKSAFSSPSISNLPSQEKLPSHIKYGSYSDMNCCYRNSPGRVDRAHCARNSVKNQDKFRNMNRRRKPPIPIEPILITSDPKNCLCECHSESTKTSSADFCEFCDCSRIKGSRVQSTISVGVVRQHFKLKNRHAGDTPSLSSPVGTPPHIRRMLMTRGGEDSESVKECFSETSLRVHHRRRPQALPPPPPSSSSRPRSRSHPQNRSDYRQQIPSILTPLIRALTPPPNLSGAGSERRRHEKHTSARRHRHHHHHRHRESRHSRPETVQEEIEELEDSPSLMYEGSSTVDAPRDRSHRHDRKESSSVNNDRSRFSSDLILRGEKTKVINKEEPQRSQSETYSAVFWPTGGSKPKTYHCVYCDKYHESKGQTAAHAQGLDVQKCCKKCCSEFEHSCSRQQFEEEEMSADEEKESRSVLSQTSGISVVAKKRQEKAPVYDKRYFYCKIKTPHDYICTDLCMNNVGSSSEADTMTTAEDLDSTYEKCFVKRAHSFICCLECVNKKNLGSKLKKRVRSVNFKNSSIVLGTPEEDYLDGRHSVLDGVHRSTANALSGSTFNGEQVIDMIFHNDDFRTSGVMASVDKEFDDYGHQITSRKGHAKTKRRKHYVYSKE